MEFCEILKSEEIRLNSVIMTIFCIQIGVYSTNQLKQQQNQKKKNNVKWNTVISILHMKISSIIYKKFRNIKNRKFLIHI